MNVLNWLETEYPDVAQELEQARSLPPISPDTSGEAITMLFDDVQPPPSLKLPADYQPDLLTYYLADDLLFVKAKGEVLLNRLPTGFPVAS